MFASMFSVLGQSPPWEDAALPPPAPRRPMNFSDLQQGFRQWNTGETDSSLSTGLLAMVAVVALIALLVHLRTRIRAQKTPDSEARLFRELARVAGLPFLTRLLLWWVARNSDVHAATLLVSPRAYDKCLETWLAQPTFAPVRRWGHRRLEHLKTRLFTP